MKKIFLTLVIAAALIGLGVYAASIDKTAASLNSDAQKPGGPDRALKSISASTHVPVATLEKEKTKTGFSYGDLYAAHAIANASGKSFSDIAALKKGGKTWDKIAEENNVSLDGKKMANKNVPKASPTPEQRSLSQEQHDRWSHRTEITNQRTKP